MNSASCVLACVASAARRALGRRTMATAAQDPKMKSGREREAPLSFWEHRLETIRALPGYVCDLDGTVYRGGQMIPGVKEFHDWALSEGKKFIFLSNTSKHSPADITARLQKMGLDVPQSSFYTSAMATADFLAEQTHPPSTACTAHVVGSPALRTALEHVGITITDNLPNYVVIGEKDNYTTKEMSLCANLVKGGARLIATNSDVFDPVEDGQIAPTCGAYVSVIEKATGIRSYSIGKPNPIMARSALRRLNLTGDKQAAIFGDRMDTDILCGVEASIYTVLVLSGVATMADVSTARWPWSPYLILNSLADVTPKRTSAV